MNTGGADMTTFSVMTFNVRGAFDNDTGPRSWAQRSALNVALIQRYAPDIIGMQEVQAPNMATYAQQFTDYDSAPGGEVSVGERVPLWWRRVRFEVLDSGYFYLNETPETAAPGWDASLVRGANWVRLRDRGSGAERLVLNAHLDHQGETARLESARLIIRQVETLAQGAPIIVMADFNSRAWEPPGGIVHDHPMSPAGTVHRVFTEAGFQDTWTANSLGDNTFHGFEGAAFPQIGLRIDWILLRGGLVAESCTIIRDAQPPVYPSDHYPVLAVVG